MTTLIDPDYWIVKPEDLDDVERYLEQFDEDIARSVPRGTRAPSKTRVGHGKFTPWAAIGAAVTALTLALTLGHVISSVETAVETWEPKRKRRRRRTELCLRTCLSITASAQEFTNSEWYRRRALTTYEQEPRTSRRFRSRA